MLNPSYPKSAQKRQTHPYILAASLAQATVSGNENFDTGAEFRLQTIYGEELWAKLERAGLSPQRLSQAHILEVCSGTGFLTYHLLQCVQPASLTVNDISPKEMEAAKNLVATAHPDAPISWLLGDLHEVPFTQKFDVIIGNSFLHHFHNVPKVLSRFHDLLNPGGVFISLHEPTPMATVVEAAKLIAYPLAVLFPGLVNDIARSHHRGGPSPTDVWVFEARSLRRVARQSGFNTVTLIPWHLMRPVVVQRHGMHLSPKKPKLNQTEVMALEKAVALDGRLNRLLHPRFFGSICLVCRKA